MAKANNMSDYDNPQITPYDRLLFVLKYRRRHVFWRIACYSLVILLLASLAFVTPLASQHGLVFLLLFELLLVFLLFSGIFQVVDLVFFKEIRLYPDRIAKAWIFGSEREIKLIDARLTNPPTRLKAKMICNQDTKWFLRAFKGIFYYEDLPDPKETKKLNYLLAALSGRKARELEEASTLEKLIKDGSTPRVVDKRALNDLDNAVLRDYMEEKKFNRTANRALIVVAVCALLAIVILWFFIIWGKSI